MLEKEITTLINEQINKEMYSSYLYLNIANYYSEKGLDGFASWFRKQATEELEHAMKFIDYMHEQGAKVVLETIEAPKHEFNDYKTPLVLQLEHEKYVTSLIYKIYAASLQANDYRTTLFLNWFVIEQQEEEKHSQDLITKFEFFATDSKGVYLLDKELSESR